MFKVSISSGWVRILLLFFAAVAGIANAQGTLPQTIQFLPVVDRPDTSAPFYVVAIASSNLPITLAVQGPATLDDRRLLTLTGAGQVTVTASQAGNADYAAAAATLSFHAMPSAATIAWQPGTLTYGMPLSSAGLHATASAIPVIDTDADTVTTSMQLDTSQLLPGAPIPYPATSSVFRYEGSSIAASPYPQDGGGFMPVSGAPGMFRVAFTCDCQQFEYVVQSRMSNYRLWVDGHFVTPDSTVPVDRYPRVNFVLVQFPDKRVRQIKVSLQGGPPFFGIVTANGDTVSAPQTPLGKRVMILGDSWTGPTILQAAIPPNQDGLGGSGYPEYLGEYFNWDYWDEGVGGTGFVNPGPAHNQSFPERIAPEVCPFSPSAFFVLGGVNDGGAASATEQAAVAATLQDVQTCLPGAPIYFYGPQFVYSGIDTAFANAVSGFSGVHYTDVGSQQWFYGSPTSANTGNEYLYFNGHPTPLGHNYLAEKFAADLIAFDTSLAPVPYALLAPQPATGSFTYSSAATALLPAGDNTVTAEFTPVDAVNYASASFPATIHVNQASTATALSLQGQTMTVTVQPQIAGTPTGSVQVSNNGSALMTLGLHGGSAVFSTASLPSGSDTLTFTYAGDSNFTGSSQSTVVSIAAPPPSPDFTVTATPATLTVASGSTGAVTLTVTPSGGLNAALALSCSGLPANSNCVLASGSTIDASGTSPVTATVQIKTTAPTSAGNQQPLAPGSRDAGIVVCGVLGVGLLGFARRTRWAARVALCAALATIDGCGSSSKPLFAPTSAPAGSYSVQLQLTNTAVRAMTHAASVTLKVQ